MPAWLRPDAPYHELPPSLQYWRRIYYATPPWADRDKIKAVYDEAARRRAAGENVVVDHIYPLQHPNFCGLHVHTNLQVLTYAENSKKSNTWHPEHPQRDLFE